MDPRIPIGGHGRPARMAGAGRRPGYQVIAAAALALTALFLGCGRVPPASFWEPDARDSSAIDSVVRANADFLRIGIAELQLTMISTVLPGSTGTLLANELTGNRFKQRFRADMIQHYIPRDTTRDSVLQYLEYTFIATEDTIRDSVMHDTVKVETVYTRQTATVSLAETIPGLFKLHVFRATDSLRESLFFPNPGETLRLPFYSDTMTPRNETLSKTMSATTASGVVLKKDNGQWSLWKISGGNRFYAPNPDDAPYFFYIYLTGGGRTDTITLRPDTLHYGMQRFYPLEDTTGEGVLTYTRLDTLKVSKISTNNAYPILYLHFRGQRYEFDNARIPLDAVPPGLYRLYVEHIPIQVMWETKGSYSGTVWGIPIRVTE
jgi:hypothetical protein